MITGSPGRTRSLQEPLFLPGLAKRLEEGTHLCLAYPFPYYNGCKVRFDIENEPSQDTAILEARVDLENILSANNLVEKRNLRTIIDRLIKIAQAFCCPKHREGWEKMQDFAYYWLAFESIPCFLESRHWEWDSSQWKCLASDHHENAGYLNKLNKADREMAYRSLTQLVVYTTFSDESNDVGNMFLDHAIVNLVEKWTCAEHRRSSDIVKAIQTNLEKDIRNAALPSEAVHSAGNTPTTLDSSSPRSASVVTRIKSFFSFLAPPDTLTSREDSRNSNSGNLRRRSAPIELPSSHSGPKTPDRPPAFRSTASESQASLESSNMSSLTSRTSTLEISPSPAPRQKINFVKSHEKYQKQPQAIFNEVLKIIRQPARTTKNLFQDGWIYVLQIPEYSEYVKIGRTTQRMEDRRKQINTCLDGVVIEEIGCETNTKVSYHERLEAIIHADLFNERYHFHCPCKNQKRNDSLRTADCDSHQSDGLTKHGEWFRIDAEEAVQRVEQWRSWMRQEPYGEPGSENEGELKWDFARRVDFFEKKKMEISGEPIRRWLEFVAPLNLSPGPNIRQSRGRRRSGVSLEG
ncbi:MAG: hypothetical protein Q9195_002469 [Heterodermia aff. obscurata]